MFTIPEDLLASLEASYRLEDVVGQGGMATVYRAHDVKHGREVAVKVLRPELAASLGAERFLKEIEIAARLSHPLVLPLHDSGQADGFLYYVMPLVRGGSLRHRLDRDGPLDPRATIEIVKLVAHALTYAHREGVVHRDVKPENILFLEDHPVVSDFGIAKAVTTAAETQLTRTGFSVGTVGYMSPEQAAGSDQLDGRTDIYSVACVCYEAFVGEPPKMWLTPEASRAGRFLDAPPHHRARLDELPGALEEVMARAMHLRAEHRFETPTAFAEALEGGLRRPKQQYDDQEAMAIMGRAADIQASQPTGEGSSLSAIQRIAADVGIPAEDVAQAARELTRRQPEPDRGGLYGVAQRLEVEEVLPAEVPEERFEDLLEEIRAEMGEVGRINPTLGTSLSWNSLSFQNSIEGQGRLVHIMIAPKSGETRIRISESAGIHAFGATFAIGFGSLVLTALVGKGFDLGVPAVLGVYAGLAGSGYAVARFTLKRFIRERTRRLRGLIDRLSALIERG